MDRAVVELDALADADGAAAQHQHFAQAAVLPLCLILLVVGGIVIGGLRVELGGAGVHHLEGGGDPETLPQGLDLLGPLVVAEVQEGDQAVGEAKLLGPGSSGSSRVSAARMASSVSMMA